LLCRYQRGSAAHHWIKNQGRVGKEPKTPAHERFWLLGWVLRNQ
jgi:hypothetical protein